MAKSQGAIDVRLIERYDTMVTDAFGPHARMQWEGNETHPAHLRWMLHELHQLQPADKANRWLGFVQGVLITKGCTTVTVEREVTRPVLTGAA